MIIEERQKELVDKVTDIMGTINEIRKELDLEMGDGHWMKKMTQDEKDLIGFCRLVAARPVPVPGKNLMVMIATLAKMLDEKEMPHA